MMPLIGNKYDIGFVVSNCNYEQLYHLEPWCSSIYVDTDISGYIEQEQSQTLYNLNERVFSIHAEKQNDIIVRFNGKQFDQQSHQYIQQLSEILSSDEELEVGTFNLGIFEIIINKIESYEQDNIMVKKDLNDYLEVK